MFGTCVTHCVLHLGGFIFKQWKKRFLVVTAEGSLLVCHDATSPPNQLVLLQSSCEAIVEGKEILDLPRLPSSGCRDCCFALILSQNKYLLLLADTPADCRCGVYSVFFVYHISVLFCTHPGLEERIVIFTRISMEACLYDEKRTLSTDAGEKHKL